MKKFITLVSAVSIVASTFLLGVVPATAENCNLMKNGRFTMGSCGGSSYFSQNFGRWTSGYVGNEQLNMYNHGNGMSTGTLGGRPLTCIKIAKGVRNCF
jgi:hypothetical protein